jgi:predicted nucleotidyltransferase
MDLDRPLDDILASASHVKLLRALHRLPLGIAASGRDLARRSGVAQPRAAVVLAQLADHGVAKVQRVPRADLYELNREHVTARALATLFETEAGFRQELLVFLAAELERAGLQRWEARLFGSAVRGEMTSSSDVDLALAGPADEVRGLEDAIPELVDLARRRFGVRLNVLIGLASLAELARGRRPAARVWQEIAREGLTLPPSPPGSATG